MKNKEKAKKLLSTWMLLGFFLLLTGLFVLPTRSAYKTVFYLFFLLPSLIAITINLKSAIRGYFRGSTLYFFLFLAYLALSSLWGDPDELISNIKRILYIASASYGIFWLYHYEKELFYRICAFSIATISAVSLFWLVDFYALSENPFSLRILHKEFDVFNLYKAGQYGSFYNPLLLSHTVAFTLLLGASLLFRRTKISKQLSNSLILCLPVALIMLVATQTRMAWVSVLSVFTVLILIRSSTKMKVIFILVLTAGAALFLQLDHSVVNRGFSLRPEIWASTLNLMPGHWLFGNGLGAHIEIHIPSSERSYSDTHNIYLEVLYYSGFTGLILLSAFILKVAKELNWSAKTSIWCTVWCVYVALSGMADGSGLIARPNEQWFKLYLPVMLILAHCRSRDLTGNIKPKQEKS